MKRLLLLLTIPLLAISIRAQSCVRYNGIASQGGKIITSGITSTTSALKVFPNSTVTVYNPTGTTTLASIFSNSACSVVKANPFTASASDASFSFYIVSPVRIDLRFSGTGITTPLTISDSILNGSVDTSLLPTAGQKDALAGTSGTPSSSNKYVTDADTATSGASKVLRLDSGGKLPALDGSQLTQMPCTTTLSPGTNVISTAVAEAANYTTICLLPGTYTQTVPIVYGNGTTTALSTQYSVSLQGLTPATSGNYATALVKAGEFAPGIVIDCNGLANTPGTACFDVRGKLTGGRVSNVTFVGDESKANVAGIQLTGAREMEFDHVAVKYFGNWQLILQNLSSCTSGCSAVIANWETTSNRFFYFEMEGPWTHTFYGISVGMSAGFGLPVSLNLFDHWGYASHTANSVPVSLGFANANTFFHGEGAIAGASTASFTFDYTFNAAFPQNNAIIAYEFSDEVATAWSTVLVNNGTPSGAVPNKLIGYRTAFGLSTAGQIFLANLNTDDAQSVATPLYTLNSTNPASFSALLFYESGVGKASVLRLGTTIDATYGKDLQIGTTDGGSVTLLSNGTRTIRAIPTGDLNFLIAGKGPVVKSPDGLTCKRIGIDNAGAITLTTVSPCP